MRKPKTLAPTPDRPNAHLEERAAEVRRGRGKLLKPKAEATTSEQAAPAPEPAQAEPPQPRTMRAPASAHPDAYGLRVDDGGLGLHAPPGSGILVEPVMPTSAGLAVFYFKGASGPTIFDLTHHFRPEFATPFAPGSEVTPLIEVVAPITGAFQRIDASRVEKIHRVTAVYVPISGADDHPRRPEPLPLLSECPESMGEQYVRDSAAYPLVRPGETVVYDPRLREPTHGALCVLQWSNGSRSVLQTNFRQSGGQGAERWWTDPVNRPSSREALERRLAQNLPGDVLHASDGPYDIDHLRERIVGTVVGVLVPERKTGVLRSVSPAFPAPAGAQPEADTAESEPADETSLPGGHAYYSAFFNGFAKHRLANVALSDAFKAADVAAVEQAGGNTPEEAMAPLEAARRAASQAEDEAWRGVFKTRPKTWHHLSLLIEYIAEHFHAHQGMDDEPDVFGAILGAVQGLRLASTELTATHDLSAVPINELEILASICRHQSDVLETFGQSWDGNPLGNILQKEGTRLGLLGSMATDEIKTRIPKDEHERNYRLEALIKRDLAGNGYIEPDLLAEALAAWGR